jgi:hypothetical protein
MKICTAIPRAVLALVLALPLVLALVLALPVRAGEMKPAATPDPGFTKLKALLGDWQATSPDGKPVRSSYKLTAAGSCIEETLTTPDGGEMVTMYHMDGTHLMMTHYCSAGNQPRMRCETAGADAKALTFTFVDASNMASKDDTHMHKLVVSFDDPTHFSQVWTLHDAGKDMPVTFHFERAKS